MNRGIVGSLPLGAGVGQLGSLVREVAGRALSAPELVLTAAGSERRKKLRLRVVILRDRDGEPVAPLEDVEKAVAEARRVLERQANVEIVPANGRLVDVLDEPAEEAALDHPCSKQGLWRADLGPAGRYFRALQARNPGRRALGFGAPVTAFVVRDVIGKCGCSLGPLGDYVTIDAGGLAGDNIRILAHELGHSCGLSHARDADNLMRPRAPGERLTKVQRALLRNSRHVTYL